MACKIEHENALDLRERGGGGAQRRTRRPARDGVRAVALVITTSLPIASPHQKEDKRRRSAGRTSFTGRSFGTGFGAVGAGREARGAPAVRCCAHAAQHPSLSLSLAHAPLFVFSLGRSKAQNLCLLGKQTLTLVGRRRGRRGGGRRERRGGAGVRVFSRLTIARAAAVVSPAALFSFFLANAAKQCSVLLGCERFLFCGAEGPGCALSLTRRARRKAAGNASGHVEAAGFVWSGGAEEEAIGKKRRVDGGGREK